jgi:hypothetical protein
MDGVMRRWGFDSASAVPCKQEAAACGDAQYIVEVDPSSSSDGASSSPFSDADMNDCLDGAASHGCSGDDEDGLLGSLASTSAGLDDELLGMPPDFYAPAACAGGGRAMPGLCEDGAPWAAGGPCGGGGGEAGDEAAAPDVDASVRAARRRRALARFAPHVAGHGPRSRR